MQNEKLCTISEDKYLKLKKIRKLFLKFMSINNKKQRYFDAFSVFSLRLYRTNSNTVLTVLIKQKQRLSWLKREMSLILLYSFVVKTDKYEQYKLSQSVKNLTFPYCCLYVRIFIYITVDNKNNNKSKVLMCTYFLETFSKTDFYIISVLVEIYFYKSQP